MTAMDRMALVLAGTLLVCAASAAPDRPPPPPGATACDLLRVPTTGSAAAGRLVAPGEPSSGREVVVAVAVARDPLVPRMPSPQPTSTCTATGDGISVTLNVWHYASQRDAARGYQGWDCVDHRRRITVAPIDHGCVWGNQHRYHLGGELLGHREPVWVSFGEAEVLLGRTVLKATVVGDGFGTNEPALANEVATVAVQRLRGR